MNAKPQWMLNPPRTLKDQIALLKSHRHLLRSQGPKGRFLRRMFSAIDETYQHAEERAKEEDPIAFFKPSWEQALLLNAWMYGISFLCVYSANRIGKTTACIINILLWILPNNPKWKIFQPYIDHLGRKVQVFPRPHISAIKKIMHALKSAPQSLPLPNPRRPHYSRTNKEVLHWLQNSSPASQSYRPAWPNTPWDKGGTIWFGAPDQDHHEQVMFPLWKSWIPRRFLDRYVPSSREMTFSINSPSGRLTVWELVGKSYESKDTKWSSGAVDAIVLTEGITPAILKEVKLRFKDPGIGSHDFTPYLPANSGAASALAQRIAKETEPLPIKHFVFMKFRVYDAPDHIITPDKKAGLIKSYENDPEGKARLEGEFYSSSMLVLSNLSRTSHLLPYSIEEMFQMFPTGRIYRGVDPGLDHPTACAWGLLLPTNQWIIYRILSEAGLTINQRCKRIIELSHNKRAIKRYGPGPNDYYRIETHPFPNSEIAVATALDFHTYKIDETTGQSHSLNYILAGLPVTESIHTRPEERAQLLDNSLELSPFRPHLLSSVPPGPNVYFLQKGPGVMAAFLKWEEFYWDRKKSGEDKGSPKDQIPTHGDDELDAVCYITGAPFRWTPTAPRAMLLADSEPEEDLIRASQQNQLRGESSHHHPNSFAMNAKLRHISSHISNSPSVFGDLEEAEEEANCRFV